MLSMASEGWAEKVHLRENRPLLVEKSLREWTRRGWKQVSQHVFPNCREKRGEETIERKRAAAATTAKREGGREGEER